MVDENSDDDLTSTIRTYAREPPTKDGRIGLKGVMNYLKIELNGHTPEESRVLSILMYLVDGGEIAPVGLDKQLKYRWTGT